MLMWQFAEHFSILALIHKLECTQFGQYGMVSSSVTLCERSLASVGTPSYEWSGNFRRHGQSISAVVEPLSSEQTLFMPRTNTVTILDNIVHIYTLCYTWIIKRIVQVSLASGSNVQVWESFGKMSRQYPVAFSLSLWGEMWRTAATDETVHVSKSWWDILLPWYVVWHSRSLSFIP